MLEGLGILYSLFLGAGVGGRKISLSLEDNRKREEARKNPPITNTYVAHDGIRDIETNKKVIISWKDGYQQVIDVENGKIIKDCGIISINKKHSENMVKGQAKYSDTYPFKTVVFYPYKGKYIRLSDRIRKYTVVVYQDIKTGELLIERCNGDVLARGDGTYVRYTDLLRNSLSKRGIYDPQKEAEKIKELNEAFEKRLEEEMERDYINDDVKAWCIEVTCKG